MTPEGQMTAKRMTAQPYDARRANDNQDFQECHLSFKIEEIFILKMSFYL
jgi:hypothetical protein